jgi:hypothetical protein
MAAALWAWGLSSNLRQAFPCACYRLRAHPEPLRRRQPGAPLGGPLGTPAQVAVDFLGCLRDGRDRRAGDAGRGHRLV